ARSEAVSRWKPAISRGIPHAYLGCMAKLNSYRELLVWQKSMTLAEQCYRMTRRFKRDDQLVLGHEIRKSCVSIPSNIAEGFGRHYTAEYIHEGVRNFVCGA